jgi:hypothetical protein
MATWVIGDIHGCAEELAQLLARLNLAADDRVVSVGDLFHRGPDPAGVVDLLTEHDAQFVLGNHELAVLKRVGLAPTSTHAADRPPLRERFPEIDEEDLAGDGGSACSVPPHRRADILVFLQRHCGFYLRHDAVNNGAPTQDGRSWCVVHAGLAPRVALEHNNVRDLTSLRRLAQPGAPWWYEEYQGAELVLFGHTPSSMPRVFSRKAKPIAIGLDTGCVYGGKLTAYSPEFDEFRSVAAKRAYAMA